MQKAKLLFLFVLALTTTAQAQTVTFNQKRSIQLTGIIDETTLTKANQLLALAETSKQPIDVLISSPGGIISYGLYFIQAMKVAQDKGIEIRCFVPQLAASMAFTIFTQCDTKVALPFAQLLFHAPRISGNFMLTPPVAVRLAQGLLGIEGVLLKLILPVMGVSKDVGGIWFTESYIDERLFMASDLLKESPKPWFKVVNKIAGCRDLFPNPYKRDEVEEQDVAVYTYVMGN